MRVDGPGVERTAPDANGLPDDPGDDLRLPARRAVHHRRYAVHPGPPGLRGFRRTGDSHLQQPAQFPRRPGDRPLRHQRRRPARCRRHRPGPLQRQPRPLPEWHGRNAELLRPRSAHGRERREWGQRQHADPRQPERLGARPRRRRHHQPDAHAGGVDVFGVLAGVRQWRLGVAGHRADDRFGTELEDRFHAARAGHPRDGREWRRTRGRRLQLGDRVPDLLLTRALPARVRAIRKRDAHQPHRVEHLQRSGDELPPVERGAHPPLRRRHARRRHERRRPPGPGSRARRRRALLAWTRQRVLGNRGSHELPRRHLRARSGSGDDQQPRVRGGAGRLAPPRRRQRRRPR